MLNGFDVKLSNDETVGDVIMAPVLAQNVEPLVVDVGARNGISLLPPSYCAMARLIAFEPNAAEFRKLVDGTTDAVRAGLPPPPTFRSTEIHDCALWDKAERRTFYITAGQGACTLMGESDCRITDRMYLQGQTGPAARTYTELHTQVKETCEIDCRPLDEIVTDRTVDFLKLDVEGAELRVLEGSRALLGDLRVLFIKTEFVCLEYYKEHPVFGDLHARLNKQGYRLLDIDFDQPVYGRNPTNIPRTLDRRLKYAGDAYFALDPDRATVDPVTLHRLAAVALIMNFRSFAVSLVQDAGLLPEEKIAEIEAALSRASAAKKLVTAWREVPYIAMRCLSRFGVRF